MLAHIHTELILAVLLYAKKLLRYKKGFINKPFFVDKSGNELRPIAASIPEVKRRGIGGAVIQALVDLRLESDASPSSHGFKVVMYNLAESIGGDFKSGSEKIMTVLLFNKEHSQEDILQLITKTADRLYF